ncbi:MAG: hypothetical protein JW924_08480 [Fusobacteriaceae bacterium]|nr:hypothetical protein [Fusobacteriaceae bacterium]
MEDRKLTVEDEEISLIDNEFDETIELESPVEIVEEYLNVDNSLIEMEKNKDLIRMEMNIVEYPIFSKNKRLKKNQIMKYHFKTDGTSYIEVTPLVNRTIPGEFEERVFIALTKIMRDKGYGRIFYTTPTEIIRNIGEDFKKLPSVYYKKVKEALHKMNESNYKFKNSLYSNEHNRKLDDEIKTNIMNIRILSETDANDVEMKFFEDKRIKEIYKISFSDYFYDNIVRKGYLVFNSEELLNIKDAVTRSVYTQITKWRNNKLYLKRPAFYIARRIPLKWDKKNLARTVKRIEESCILLKEMGFIKTYNLIKNKKWEQAEFEFIFDEEHNRIQQENFFKEREEFKITYVEEKDLDTIDITDINEEDEFEEENTELIDKIISILPEKARNIKSLRPMLDMALSEYEFEYVMWTAEYTAINCKQSIKKYLGDALENNWAEEFIAEKKLKETRKKEKTEEKQLKLTLINEENEKNKELEEEFLYLWKLYEEKSSKEKSEIEAKAYEEFLKDIGQFDTKLNRAIFEKTKKNHIVKVIEKMTQYNEEVIKIENEFSLVKVYESLSMFLLEVMKVLEENDIKDFQKIVQIIPVLSEFKGTIGNKKINIKYNEGLESVISINTPH